MSSKSSLFGKVLPYFLSVALLLIAWRVMTFDYRELWQDMLHADARYMCAAGLIYFMINFLIVWRWRILMRAMGLKPGRLSSTRWFFIGVFCTLAPISTVGSDVIRGLGIAQELGSKPKVFASIVLDRLSGFAGIVILALVAYMFGHRIVNSKLVLLAIAALTVISLGLVVVLFSHRIFSFACRAFHSWPKVKDSLMRLHYDIVLLKGKQRQGWDSIFISIAAQIVLAIEFYLSAKGLHQNIPLEYFIVFSPIVCVVTTLPSIGGLGFREISWAYFLPLVGVSTETAWGISLINTAFTILNALLGGLFYVTTLSSGRIQYSAPDGVAQRPVS